MNISNLIKYQDVDFKLYKLEKKLLTSEEKKKMDSCAKDNAHAMDELRSYNKKVEDLFSVINRFSKEISKISEEVNDIVDTVESFEEPREIDLFEKKLNQIMKNIESGERDIKAAIKDINEIDIAYKGLVNLAKKSMLDYASNKKAYDQNRKTIGEEAQGIIAELKQMASDIDADIIAKYKSIRSNKMPVLVRVNSKTCGGCGMELDTSAMSILEQKSVVDCPNCSRLVYKD